MHENTLHVAFFLFFGITNSFVFAVDDGIFNVAFEKRPAVWPPDGTCGRSNRSEFCADSEVLPSDGIGCINQSRCEPACLATFYYIEALDNPGAIVNALAVPQSTGFSDCVVKNYTFICPKDRDGKFSVRFKMVPAINNCSLIVEHSWLDPVLRADSWNITISMWVYSEMQETTVGTLVEITSTSERPGPLLRIFLNSTNIVIQSGTFMWTDSSWFLPVYRWTHFAFTVFEDIINIFVDGQIVSPGAYNLKLLPHDIINDFRLGQSTSGDTQFTGFLQNVQIFFGALSNREIMYMYNGLANEGFLVQPNCTCPSKYPALAVGNSLECQQNPGTPNPDVSVPRINPQAHPVDYITDGDPDTFWVSDMAAASETNSIVIDFGSIYTVMLLDLFFFNSFPLATDIWKKRSPTLPWEPWLSFGRNCSNIKQDLPCVSLNGSALSNNDHLVFYLNGSREGSEFNLASAVNISMVGYRVDRDLFWFHGLYEVVINATCYCYGSDDSCDSGLQSCTCNPDAMNSGPNCEKCVTGYYLNSSANDHVCRECDCDFRGTIEGRNNCDMSDGNCRCKANVKGDRCDSCVDGYHNLTMSDAVGCQPCRCQTNNTVSCDGDTGECSCVANVEGSSCDRCRATTFRSKTGQGCDDCDCLPGGSLDRDGLDCDASSGQCLCKGNVAGRDCGRCKLGFYGLSDELVDGCLACNCSLPGSVEGMPCDEVTGRCICCPGQGNVSLGGLKCESYLSEVFPTFGPESGGTAINMTVGFVGNIIANVSVHIGPMPCIVNYNISSPVLIACITSSIRNSSDLLNESLPLTIRLPGGRMLVARDAYVYKPDPLIEKVWPLRTIESGGINLTVVGSSLSSVAFPRLSIMMTQLLKDGSQNVTTFQSACYHVATDLICPTPNLSLPPTGSSSRKRRGLSHRMRRQLDANNTKSKPDDLRFYIGFVFDGVKKYLNLSETLPRYGLLDVYSNPTLYPFTESNRVKIFHSSKTDNDSTISIQGCDLNLGAGISDFIVHIGLEICVVMTLTSNQLTCIPPASQPKPENEYFTYEGLPAVNVTVGNIENIPGYLKYAGEETVMDDAFVRSIVIGVVVAVAVVIAVVVSSVVISKHNKRLPKHFDRLSVATDDSYRSPNLYSRPKSTLKSRSIYLTPVGSVLESFLCRLPDELRLKVEDCLLEGQDLSLFRILGQGNFGQVFVGELTGNDNEPLQVAVKTIKDRQFESNPDDVIGFLEEATLMHQLHHEHILSLIGIVLKPISAFGIYVVLPLMGNGDLRSFVSSKDNVLTVKALTEFGLQVADGMKYLELNKFVHRDLACRNCMVSDSLVVKVADFGLSRSIYEKDYYRASGSKHPLPVKWMAMESLETGVFTTKSDVWSYGILLWELMTRGCSPYPDVDHMNVKAHLKTGSRLGRPGYAPDEIYSIMTRCWQENPDARPTFESIEHQISQFLKTSMKPEDSSEQETEDGNKISGIDDQNTDYVRLSDYRQLCRVEADECGFPGWDGGRQDTDGRSGTATTDQTELDAGHLLEFNGSNGATLSNASFESKDNASTNCNVSSEASYNPPFSDVKDHPIDDIASEFTRL